MRQGKRHLIQALAAIAHNPHLGNFFTGRIYQGPTKGVCVPGLNCYSCPGAAGACPIGSLQAVVGGRGRGVPYYVTGSVLLFGALFGRLICGFLCPFGFVQDLLHKILSPKPSVPRRLDWALRRGKYASLAAVLLLLSGCAGLSGRSLPLETYNDPQGRFEFAIPEGWESVVDDQMLTITPPDYSSTEEELIVRVYASPTGTTDTATHLDLAKQELEPFLSAYIDDEYEVVNEGSTRVDKYPSMLLDFAKPHEESYMLGRVLIVAMPFYVLVFLGTAVEADWEAFLPTFREMLDKFHMLTPIEPEAQ